MLKDRNTLIFIVVAVIVIGLALIFRYINKKHEEKQTRHLYVTPVQEDIGSEAN